MEQAPPSLYPMSKTSNSTVIMRNSIAPRQFFSSKGHAIPVMEFSTLVLKSCCGRMEDLLRKKITLWIIPEANAKTNYFWHSVLKEGSQKLLHSWDCSSTPHPQVNLVDIWMPSDDFSFNHCVTLCLAPCFFFFFSTQTTRFSSHWLSCVISGWDNED